MEILKLLEITNSEGKLLNLLLNAFLLSVLWWTLALTDFLVGTGGWAYFQVPNKQSLKTYSELFHFVEVNSTFYEYPKLRYVEQWRKIVPAEFVFSVRCHQDLTHRIGLKPTNQAFECIYKMKTYCTALQTPFLVLETPASLNLRNRGLCDARDFFSSVSFSVP